MMEQHIKKWNQYYEKNKEQVTWGYDKEDSHIRCFVEETISLLPNTRILDVGCGFGKNAQIFLEAGLFYIGIDIAKYPIDSAKKRILDGKFLCGDILKFEFPYQFGMIVDAGCIHVNSKENIHRFLEKYQTLLAPGGKLFIRLFKSDKILEEPLYIIDDILPVWGYTEKEIRSIVEKYFYIDKILLDTDFYKEDSVFYLYLSNKNDT